MNETPPQKKIRNKRVYNCQRTRAGSDEGDMIASDHADGRAAGTLSMGEALEGILRHH
jgi:hypothetical protein